MKRPVFVANRTLTIYTVE